VSQFKRVFVFNYVRAKQDYSDHEALKALRRDPDAICTLYDRHVAGLAAGLLAAGADRDVAFEIVQETFARTLEHGHRVRIRPTGSARPWLWSVAHNLLVDHQRRGVIDAAARTRLPLDAEDPFFGHHPEDAYEALRVAIARYVSGELSAQWEARKERADMHSATLAPPRSGNGNRPAEDDELADAA